MDDLGLISGTSLFLVLTVLVLFVSAITREQRNTDSTVNLFLSAFTLRFVCTLAIYQMGIIEIIKDEDGSGWSHSVTVAQIWQSEGRTVFDLPSAIADTTLLKEGHWGYTYMLGTFFFLTGLSTRLPAAVLNCFFGALTVVATFWTARTLFSARVADVAGWLVCLWPSLIIWSAQTLKEPSVQLLESLVIYGCVALNVRGFSFRHLLLCVISALLLYPFRFYAAYLAVVVTVLTLGLLGIDRRGLSRPVATWLGLGVTLAILVATILYARRDADFEKYTLARAHQFGRDVSVGQGSGVELQIDLESPTDVVRAAVVGALHLLLAPFPWQFGGGSLRLVMTLPEVVSWWIIFLVGVLPGLWLSMRRRLLDILPLLVFVCGLGIVYSVSFGNVGLAYRQRAQLIPWFMIFAAVAYDRYFIAQGKPPAMSPRVFPAANRLG